MVGFFFKYAVIASFYLASLNLVLKIKIIEIEVPFYLFQIEILRKCSLRQR